jgi:hypothetical protein
MIPVARRSLLAAVVVVAALLAAGCGSSSSSSSDTTPTATWADGLCTAVTTWKSSITSIVDSLKGGNLSQESLTSAADDAKKATETFTSSLKGLGTPDTQAGKQATAAVDQLTTDIQADVKKIEDTVAGASGLAGLVSAVPVISSTVTTAGNQLSSTITTLQGLDAKGELQDAFNQAESCKTLMGNG